MLTLDRRLFRRFTVENTGLKFSLTSEQSKELDMLIFDWDGTLVDTGPIMYEAVVTFFARFGVPPPPMEKWLEEISPDFLPWYHEQGIPRTVGREELHDHWGKHAEQHKHRILLRPGALDVLQCCSDVGILVAVVSGTNADVIDPVVSRFGIGVHFDAFGTGVKDKHIGLVNMLRRFSLSPKNAAYVDDTHIGLVSAKKAGLTAIGITGGFHSRESLLQANPDHLIASLEELL